MSLLKTVLLWLGVHSASDVSSFSCDIFLAPSKLNGGGWGVYAARDFEESEVVEHAPLYLVLPHDAPHVKNSVLDDYHYGIYRNNTINAAISLGMIMWYNHAQEPNVRWVTTLGRGEPSWEDEQSGTLVGIVTHRAIAQGEELFSAYGFGEEGPKWFASRRLTMMTPFLEESKISLEQIDDYKSRYCSKSFAGPSKSTYKDRFMPADQFYLFRPDKLPSVDAPCAIAKASIMEGERIEIAPGLVMSKSAVTGTALAPLVFSWSDLQQAHHDALRELRRAGQLKLQYQSPETNWHRLDRFESFDRTVIFPAAGNIGVMERVGTFDPNCGMRIQSSGSGDGSAGIVLEAFALKNITAGETLRLNIPPAGTEVEKQALLEILETTGQLIPESLRSKSSQERIEL